MSSRRRFLQGIGAVSTVGVLAGCTGSTDSSNAGSGDQTTATTTIATSDSVPFGDNRATFYMSPSEPQQLMEAQYAPVKTILQRELPVETATLRYAAGYSAVLQSLAGGTGDIAETGPFAAALGVDNNRCNIILQRYGYGSWTYASVIATREDSSIESLADLEGERVAFADRLSASGALYPLFMLKQAGLNIGNLPTDSGDTSFTAQFSSHAEAFAALERGQVAAAGVGKFITLDDNRELKNGFQYIETTTSIPRAPIVVSPELSADEQTAIKDALLTANESIYVGEDGEPDTDDDLWFSDVREADDETYQPVVDVANELGVTTDLLDS
ncbi:phosphate/phosphite/phosphonate ABC transporter substrate-binding protein [Haloquadratum walsbyi]|jgi:phosphate/phosphite/phosphonate ABC transporters, periplasmic binding protein|uniref:ABC-type phosphate/phosphonate transport system, periplasmic component n=1 Tax=Haloquadratum walsbyi J07HQW2 TaxID=1238425 RepID=U1PV46_9EURY|nr:phosphate/phosphite/phosphonate ABC transporter substrate-binding protein [Haloquadratum walsbyi]ERG96266.1 MAG: ABC-type phosphate/phosphonate transport system, periplasmic component [Haloquadratum walsbyi J07HQW2]